MKVWDAATGQGVIAFGHAAPEERADPADPDGRVHRRRRARLGLGRQDAQDAGRSRGRWSEIEAARPARLPRPGARLQPRRHARWRPGGGEPSRSGEIKVWDVGKGMLVRSLDALHSDTVFGAPVQPRRRRSSPACAADKFLKVTSVADGKELKSFEGHTHHVLAVDWKSDGKQLVTGGADNVLKVWDFETGEQLRTLQAAGKQVTAVRWVPGKPQVVGASGDKLVRFWNADNGGDRAGPSPAPATTSSASPSPTTVATVAAGGADSVLFLWNGAERPGAPQDRAADARAARPQTAAVKP